jgi:gliding motility-associated-like protein
MSGKTKILTLLSLGFLMMNGIVQSQRRFEFSLLNTKEKCEKGIAVLNIKGHLNSDSVFVNWSNGETGKRQLLNLNAGDYSVYVKIKYVKDSLIKEVDTLIHFVVEKEACSALVGKYFSPNDDGYNDYLQIHNVNYYPDFELHIYNKWGQRVHFQKAHYVPWDGKWAGIDLPDGTYYYVFFYKSDDRESIEKGDITIIR